MIKDKYEQSLHEIKETAVILENINTIADERIEKLKKLNRKIYNFSKTHPTLFINAVLWTD